MFVAISILGS